MALTLTASSLPNQAFPSPQDADVASPSRGDRPMGLLSRLAGKGRSPGGGPDIASPRHKANPYPFYARLPAEAPVCQITLSNGQTVWLVSRYDEVVSVLKDDRFAKDKWNALAQEQARLVKQMRFARWA
jgi:cytochrome P450